MSKQVVLTGLRTNAEYHLGNYIGAILPMVKFAREKAADYQVNMFAPDLHSFTTEIDHSKLYQQTMDNLKLFIACGLPIDHENVFLYRQSRISAHSELTIILNNFSPWGELMRMREFQEKAGFKHEFSDKGALLVKTDVSRDKKMVTAGLFDYPVLMACDILLYDALWIPVGEDQRQHIEFTRNLAERINNKFGDILTVPKTLEEQQHFVGREGAPRIRSLRDPSKKMSKSVEDPAGTIKLSDTPEEASKKIMSATTDNVGSINFDWENQPGVTNLLQILALLSGRSQNEVNDEWVGNERYGDLKKAVAEVVNSTLQNIQNTLDSVDDDTLQAKLESSEKAMNNQANKTLLKVQKAVGLR